MEDLGSGSKAVTFAIYPARQWEQAFGDVFRGGRQMALIAPASAKASTQKPNVC